MPLLPLAQLLLPMLVRDDPLHRLPRSPTSTHVEDRRGALHDAFLRKVTDVGALEAPGWRRVRRRSISVRCRRKGEGGARGRLRTEGGRSGKAARSGRQGTSRTVSAHLQLGAGPLPSGGPNSLPYMVAWSPLASRALPRMGRSGGNRGFQVAGTISVALRRVASCGAIKRCSRTSTRWNISPRLSILRAGRT